MSRKVLFVVVLATILSQVASVALASGPIVVDPNTAGFLNEDNQVVQIAQAEDGTVWAGSSWAGTPDSGLPSVAGSAPFYAWGQQTIAISYSADGGAVVDMGWSDWDNPVLRDDGLAYQVQIPVGAGVTVEVWVEIRESDCWNYGGEAYGVFVVPIPESEEALPEEEQVPAPKEDTPPGDKADSPTPDEEEETQPVSEEEEDSAPAPKGSGPPFGTFYIHTSEEILQTFAFQSAGSLLEPWNNEDDALRKVKVEDTTDKAIGSGDKITLAEGQWFILWGHDIETGEYRLVGIGNVLFGKPGSVELWPEGDECSVVDNIFWCPPGAVKVQ